jgi:hypothetical protein
MQLLTLGQAAVHVTGNVFTKILTVLRMGNTIPFVKPIYG